MTCLLERSLDCFLVVGEEGSPLKPLRLHPEVRQLPLLKAQLVSSTWILLEFTKRNIQT